MLKVILPALMLFSNLNGHEWLDIKDHAIPIDADVIFYDSGFDELYIGNVEEYIYFCVIMMDVHPVVEWWMPAPMSPKELGLLDAED